MKHYTQRRKPRDWIARDWVDFSITLLIWGIVLWIFSGVLELIAAEFGGDIPSIDPVSSTEVKSVVIRVFRLIVLAYGISILFLFWRWAISIKNPPVVSQRKVPGQLTADFYSLSLDQVLKMRKHNIQRVRVNDDGSLVPLE